MREHGAQARVARLRREAERVLAATAPLPWPPAHEASADSFLRALALDFRARVARALGAHSVDV